MMKRLTVWDFEGEFCNQCSYYGEPNGCNKEHGQCEAYYRCLEIFDKLAAYEKTGLAPARVAELAQVERDGRLAILPCKINDVVYEVYNNKRIIKHEILSFSYGIRGWQAHLINGESFRENSLNKYVFFTRAEAETALERMKSDA
jgi:hypothetical protein